MKKLILMSLLLSLLSCSKDPSDSISIIDKWNIVSDAYYSGVGLSNHLINYTGKSGDYFDFRTDGNVYTKENAILDTLSYRVVSNSAIIIQHFPADTSQLSLTNLTAIITTPVLYTPGGNIGRTVHLRR